ncbi:L,D-transpeptidase [Rhizobium sp. TH2]|uniref:L,D-transpeptidase n=1 Tax=Rhizobium sp. TH2 TaxID=2775403 RepID=UPI0021577E98|nr:L,D-transpeptidase [Rhizobium sp. TH2]UVC06764.1 L,D-transpeptidase [Rhizobium sp. TH2]
MKTRTALSLISLLAAPMLLSGCVINSVNDLDIYDSSTVNPDRFVQQTRPVWDRPPPSKKRRIVWYEGDVEETTALTGDMQAEFPLAEVPTDTQMKPDLFTTNTVPRPANVYGKLDDAGHWLPAIPVSDVPGQYLRREVSYNGIEVPGSVVVDTKSRHLYLVLEGHRAIRYGVGIGRMGYSWKGRGTIKFKKSWPRWTPSENYVADRPDMKMFSASYGGLVGGTNNPLGARALYIFQDGQDTLYRVHGTPDWKSVGKQVSSGCIRMFNQDVIDLYNRVENGAEIIVR